MLDDREDLKALLIELFDIISPEGREILFEEVMAHSQREPEAVAQI